MTNAECRMPNAGSSRIREGGGDFVAEGVAPAGRERLVEDGGAGAGLAAADEEVDGAAERRLAAEPVGDGAYVGEWRMGLDGGDGPE